MTPHPDDAARVKAVVDSYLGDTPAPPRHWAWHPFVQRFVWPVWARLGFWWFLSVDGKFYMGRAAKVRPGILRIRDRS